MSGAVTHPSARHEPAAPQVLIVGAGPVGLVAACELARHGVVPRLVDKLLAPTTQYRAVGVQPRSQEMLATLGVLDRVRALSLPQVAIEIGRARRDGWQALERLDFSDLPTRYPNILNLPQTATEAVLGERAAELGVTVERGITVSGLNMDATGVDVVLTSRAGVEAARYDWVIGADGAHSTVRKAVGSKLEGTFHGSHFIVADVSVDSDFPSDTTRLFADPGGLTVMMCMLNERTRLLFQVPDPGPGAAAPTFSEVQRLAAERTGGHVRVRDPHWLSHYSIRHAQVPQYRVGRALLAGDAAHIHSPAGGQGMNTGMQDAANLGWKLALVCRGLADARLMDSYHAERHPVGAGVVRLTTVMANGMTLTGPPAWIRDTAMRTIGHSKPLRRALASRIAQVTVAYPRSPITAVTGSHPAGPVAPGTHTPDPPGLRTADGRSVTVSDLLQQPGHLLLALTDSRTELDQLHQALGGIGRVVPVAADADGEEATAVIDSEHLMAQGYGIGPRGVVLIRPDGYIGYLSSRPDPMALRTHLTTQLGATGDPAVLDRSSWVANFARPVPTAAEVTRRSRGARRGS